MANGAGVEVAAQVIVEQERIGFLRAFLVAEGVSPAVGTQLAAVASTVADVVDVDLHVAGVLGEFPVVVQLALEEVAERGVPHLVLAHVRIAQVSTRRDVAEGRVGQRTVHREALFGATLAGLQVAGQERDAGVLVRLPGQRRSDIGTVVRRMIDLGTAVTLERHQAIAEFALVIQSTTEIQRRLLAIELPP